MCRVGQTKAASICGTLTVYEDRASRSGRTIDIHFIVIEAKHRTNRALAFNPGGPGAAATAEAADFADITTGAFATLRNTYDILLVDNRGTGGSAPQQCDFAPEGQPELYFQQMWPDTLVRACHDRLAAHANLSLYGTSKAADDLDDVRTALGYPKLLLFGGSYGTRFYLDYARRHPTSVESLILEGVAPPHFEIIPLQMARGAQTAIDNLEKACGRDATCSAHFPHFAEHFAAVLHRFDDGPITMGVRNPETGRMQDVRLSKEVFVETIRHAMYFPAGAAYIPVTIERAYGRNYTPLSEMTGQMALFFSNIEADGLNLSVTCVEDIPFITEANVIRETSGTFEGAARVRAQQRACKLWNVEPVSSAFVAPVHSQASMLMISGGDDPASPPDIARSALAYLPNARIMLVPGASHDSDYPPCVDATILAFVRSGSAFGLDLGRCAAAYRRPAFVTLAYDEVAEGENAVRTERFSKILHLVLQGKLDRSQFTPTFSKQFSQADLKGLASDLHDEGRLEAIVFKGESGNQKAHTYKYLMRFSRGNLLATFILNAAGRIDAFDLSPS
jgi:pimeloyl-ACP methyl ester carboxylesterase